MSDAQGKLLSFSLRDPGKLFLGNSIPTGGVVCPKPFPFLFTEDPQVPAFNYLFPPVLLGEVPEKITRRDLGEQEVFAHTALTNRNKSWKNLTASF